MKFIKNLKLFCYEHGSSRSFRIVEMNSAKVHIKPCDDNNIEIIRSRSDFKKTYWIPTGKKILV